MNGDPALRLFSARVGGRCVLGDPSTSTPGPRAVAAVRQAGGAATADVAIMTVHAHQGDADPADPPGFLRTLAHDAIEAGADAVAISGPHVFAPIELVDGRPVFYGLSNFLWSDLGGPVPAYFWSQTRAVLGDEIDPASMTEAELVDRLNADGFSDPWVFRAILAEVVIGPSGVQEVRLHPVDLGQGLPITRRGIPRTPSPVVASEILERIASLSAPLGTNVDSADGVGTIRLG